MTSEVARCFREESRAPLFTPERCVAECHGKKPEGVSPFVCVRNGPAWGERSKR